MQSAPTHEPETLYVGFAQLFFRGSQHGPILCRFQHAWFTEPLPDDDFGDPMFSLRRVTPSDEELGEEIGRVTVMSHSLTVATDSAEDAALSRAQIISLLQGVIDPCVR